MPALTLIIGNKNYSSWSLRAWLAMRQAEIPFDEVLIPLDTPEAFAQKVQHAPTARVPVLRAGDLAIWDSLAICEYLAETFPDRQLWPANARARARARSICSEMHAGFAALRNNLPLNCRARRDRILDRGADVQQDIERVLACWRETRDEFAGDEGPFLFGKFTIADAFFAPVASRFFTYDVPLDDVASAYQETLFSLPAFQEWMMAAETEPMELPSADVFR